VELQRSTPYASPTSNWSTSRSWAAAIITTIWAGPRATSPVISAAPAPFEIEGVAFRATLRILDAHDHRSAASAHQVLISAPVDPAKMQVGRVRGHGLIAFETAPARRLSRQGADPPLGLVNLDFGDAIHFHFDGALAVAAATANLRLARIAARLAVQSHA
jgi:hypothetical protein